MPQCPVSMQLLFLNTRSDLVKVSTLYLNFFVLSLQCKGPRSEWLLSKQDMQAYEREDLRFRQELNRWVSGTGGVQVSTPPHNMASMPGRSLRPVCAAAAEQGCSVG